jgi:hypothetical protein
MKRKGVIRSRKSKDNQYDVEMKSANNGLQITAQKTKRFGKHEPH